MLPLSVTPTLAPDEADDTAICARKSLAGTSRREYRPETSPPAARDRRGRLRCDGPGTGWGSCDGRSSRRDSIALDARVARRPGAPGVGRRAGDALAAATGPDSDLAPVRGLELAQTTNVGGVEYLQRAKLNAATPLRMTSSASAPRSTATRWSSGHL